MKDKKVRNAILKFRLIEAAILVCLLIIVFLLVYFVDNRAVELILLVPVLIVSIRLQNQNLYKNVIYTIYKTLNNEQYLKLISSIYRLDSFNHASTFYRMGDYQTALNISVSALKKKRIKPLKKCYWLDLITLIYLYSGDLEKARIAYGNLCDTISTAKNGREIQKYFLNLDFYKHYFNGELDACLEDVTVRAAYVDKLYQNAINYELLAKTPIVQRGMVCYKQGELEQARACFERISNDDYLERVAPHYVILSKKYLEAIETGYECSIAFTEMLPQDSCVTNKKIKRHKAFTKIFSLICAILGILILVTAYLPDSTGLKYISNEDKEELFDSLSEQYESYSFVKLFWVENDGEEIACLCVVESEGSINLHSVLVYIPDETTYARPQHKDISAGQPASLFTVDGDYLIRYCIYDNKKDIPRDAIQVEKIRVDGETLYFCILSINS